MNLGLLSDPTFLVSQFGAVPLAFETAALALAVATMCAVIEECARLGSAAYGRTASKT